MQGVRKRVITLESIMELPAPPQATKVMFLLANMPTEARTNPTVEMARINLKGWQQSRWPGREGQEGGL